MAWPLAMMLVSLAVQGFGVGLFQVAYLDAVIDTMPRAQRGVAGSLAMLTRTLGIVGGATFLTLLFHAVEGAAPAGHGFLAAYATTFRLAGLFSLLAGALVFVGRRR
jgi:MFS family permease